jgi:hypothetical protein
MGRMSRTHHRQQPLKELQRLELERETSSHTDDLPSDNGAFLVECIE